MHGANRLGGNSLSDLLVFGRIAGEHASKYVKDAPATKPHEDAIKDAEKEALEYFNREEGENPFLLHEKLKDEMQTYVGIIRTAEDLEKGLAAIEALKKRVATIKVEDNRHFNAAWHEAFDMRNMMIVAEAMCRGAIMRKESRGAHARDDFQKMDDAHFGKHNIISKNDGGAMKTEEVPLPPVPDDIKKILDDKE
jgi:succinate dehydrogenase / fumarate reductase flavoprotein subunit